MLDTERAAFATTIAGVYDFYGKAGSCNEFALQVWWEAMKNFDLPVVREALSRHCLNPDNGQFLPRPADVVRMMGGTSKDSALIAWAKVDKAVRDAGAYSTVVFDDPLIHRAIDELGGWIWLCGQPTDEWHFVEKRFCDHYRAYKARGEVPAYPKKLLGRYDAQNLPLGYEEQKPVVIGDVSAARLVFRNGSDGPGGLQRLDQKRFPGDQQEAA